jgi:BlaI family transcriptional regulator, penicillinase repressor
VARIRTPSGASLAPLELSVMQIVWRSGSCTVLEVQRHLTHRRPLAYTTVQTVMNKLCRKGKLSRRLNGKAFLYTASISRESTLRSATKDLIERFFLGSVDDLLMNLVNTRTLDRTKLQLIETVLRDKDG